jgi:hypothetical protein
MQPCIVARVSIILFDRPRWLGVGIDEASTFSLRTKHLMIHLSSPVEDSLSPNAHVEMQ